MTLTGTDRGTGGNNTGATSIGIVPTSNLTPGTWAVICLAYDNAGASGADPFSSISDSLGNTWTTRRAALYDPGAASAGVALRIFTSAQEVGALATSDTVTVSFGAVSVVAKAWTMFEVAPTPGNVVVFVTSGVNTGAATATPTVTTSSSITVNNIVIGAGGSESTNTWVGDADTTNGNWSTQQTTGFGTGTSGIAVTSQRKVVTATATQTYNPMLVLADCILAWVSLAEVLGSAMLYDAQNVQSINGGIVVNRIQRSKPVWC